MLGGGGLTPQRERRRVGGGGSDPPARAPPCWGGGGLAGLTPQHEHEHTPTHPNFGPIWKIGHRVPLVVPLSGATMKAPGCQGLWPSVCKWIIARYFGWLAAAWPSLTHTCFGWPFLSPVLCRNHYNPPSGFDPVSSTVVWAMVMGENEEVGCGLWCVGCDLWLVVYGLCSVGCGLCVCGLWFI